jgi:hypothetical protein
LGQPEQRAAGRVSAVRLGCVLQLHLLGGSEWLLKRLRLQQLRHVLLLHLLLHLHGWQLVALLLVQLVPQGI